MGNGKSTADERFSYTPTAWCFGPLDSKEADIVLSQVVANADIVLNPLSPRQLKHDPKAAEEEDEDDDEDLPEWLKSRTVSNRSFEPMGVGSRTLSDGGLSSVGSRTLSDQDPEIAARHGAYTAKNQSKRTNSRFLSGVFEINADVEYRFNLHALGMQGFATKIIDRACTSAAASSLKAASRNRSESRLPGEIGATRCICKVTEPSQSEEVPARIKLAKLAFVPLNFGEQLPQLTNRADALNTTLVYALCIDPSPDELSVKDQLDAWVDILIETRRVKSKLRASRALLLVQNGDEVSDDYKKILEDFEFVDGLMWRFGPIKATDGDALHETFAKIASVRIQRFKASKGDSDGSHESSVAASWRPEQDANIEDIDEEEEEEEDYMGIGPKLEAQYLTKLERGAA